MRKFPQRNSGSVAVEFAIILPLLLLIVFGIIEYSVALFDKAIITNASREAARSGIVLRKTKLTTDEIKAIANAYCTSNLVSLGGASTPTVTVSGAGGAFGTNLTVSISYTYRGLGLGSLISTITSPITLTASSTMTNE